MDCSMPGFPVCHQLPELAQTHVHWVCDAVQPLILCCPLLFPASIFPSIRVFSKESVLSIRWPKYWSFSFSISSSNEYSGVISFRIDWLDLLAVQGTLKSLLQHHSSWECTFTTGQGGVASIQWVDSAKIFVFSTVGMCFKCLAMCNSMNSVDTPTHTIRLCHFCKLFSCECNRTNSEPKLRGLDLLRPLFRQGCCLSEQECSDKVCLMWSKIHLQMFWPSSPQKVGSLDLLPWNMSWGSWKNERMQQTCLWVTSELGHERWSLHLADCTLRTQTPGCEKAQGGREAAWECHSHSPSWPANNQYQSSTEEWGALGESSPQASRYPVNTT